MLSGAAPFRAADTRRLEQQIRSRRIGPPLDAACPVGLQAVVGKLLAPTPADRYDTARAIRDDLEHVAAGTPTQAERDGWPTRAIDEAPTRRTRPPADHAAVDEATRRTTAAGLAPSAQTAAPS